MKEWWEVGERERGKALGRGKNADAGRSVVIAFPSPGPGLTNLAGKTAEIKRALLQ